MPWQVKGIADHLKPSPGLSKVSKVNITPLLVPHPLDVGPDPNNPKPLLAGVTRIYRGLGVSALRSITTHGLLWTFFDLVSNYIDALPQ